MSYNGKNYMEQGGDKWVIGGTLEIKEGASVTGLPAAEVPQAANQADSVAEDVSTLVSDFNGLLAKLKAAGLMVKKGMKTILTAIDEIKRGVSICIFPEGTRNKGDSELNLLPFHEGSFKIATKAGCPVVPIAITNSAEIFEAHFPRIKPCKVIVEYGTPIYPDQLSKEEKRKLGSYTQEILLDMLKKNRAALDCQQPV